MCNVIVEAQAAAEGSRAATGSRDAISSGCRKRRSRFDSNCESSSQDARICNRIVHSNGQSKGLNWVNECLLGHAMMPSAQTDLIEQTRSSDKNHSREQ